MLGIPHAFDRRPAGSGLPRRTRLVCRSYLDFRAAFEPPKSRPETSDRHLTFKAISLPKRKSPSQIPTNAIKIADFGRIEHGHRIRRRSSEGPPATTHRGFRQGESVSATAPWRARGSRPRASCIWTLRARRPGHISLCHGPIQWLPEGDRGGGERIFRKTTPCTVDFLRKNPVLTCRNAQKSSDSGAVTMGYYQCRLVLPGDPLDTLEVDGFAAGEHDLADRIFG